MRYYNIILTDPTSGKIWTLTQTGDGLELGAGPSTFTSYVNGKTIAGALNVEFNIPVYPYNTPQGNSSITIWGVGLKMISQAANLNGANITLAAGMKPGLPLATAAAGQAGILVQGQVFQAYGNWQGTNQSMNLVCNPGAAVQGMQNIPWNWPKGTSLASAVYTTLARAFPTYKVNVNISGDLTLSNAEPGFYQSLTTFADAVNAISLKVGVPIYGENYTGILITLVGNTLQVTDGSVPPNTIQLNFQDLIGQPTWINPSEVSFKTVMRSDIAVGSQIQFPQGIQSPYALTAPAAAVPNTPAASKTAFQGKFIIKEVHHFANFRSPSADSWVTAFVGIPALVTP